MLLTTIFCFFAPVKDYRKVFNNTRRRLRKPTLPVGRRGSLMLSVTIFCYCPCQYLLYISALTARFAYVVGCCILPLPLSAFTAYFFVDGAVCLRCKTRQKRKNILKNRRLSKIDKNRQKEKAPDKNRQKATKADKARAKMAKTDKRAQVATNNDKNVQKLQKANKPLKSRQNSASGNK